MAIDLQASPATAASASIRIFASTNIGAEPVAHTFKFTKPAIARQEMEKFVLALQNASTKKAAEQKAPPKPSVSEILANQDVESDTDLQEALLKSNPDLANTFREAVINGSVTPAQFWSSRTHLLRAFLIEKSQQKGPYNVLATIRPKTVDNKIIVNMTREKIRDVFSQHPLLRRIYDETVPPLGEDEFWSRFFVSRLCKKLRGERLLSSDPVDDKLDKYIGIEEEESRKRAREEEDEFVPKVINLEGNEAHNSKKMGNAPDFTMRPSHNDVINSINSISLRMLDSLTPKIIDSGTLHRQRNETFEDDFYQQEIQLGDLTIDKEDARILLNIRDQTNFFNAVSKPAVASDNTGPTPAEIVATLQSVVPDDIQLHASQDKYSTEIESTAEHIQQDISTASTRQHSVAAKDAFSSTIWNQMAMSHSATSEFLSLFWSLFLSGDPTKAKSLSKITDSLKRTSDRIESVARKASTSEESESVRRAMQPTQQAVERALAEYQCAVDAATKEMAVVATTKA